MNSVVLIPAFNEADTIAATVKAVWAIPLVVRVLVIDDCSVDDTAALAAQAGAEVVRCEKNIGKGAALQRGVSALSTPVIPSSGSPSPDGSSVSDAQSAPLSGISGIPLSDAQRTSLSGTLGTSLPGVSGASLSATPGTVPSSDAKAPPDIVLLLDGDLGASACEAESLLKPVVDGLADMTIGVLPKPLGSGGFGVVKDLARGAIRDWGGGYDAQAPLSGQRALTWECLQATLPFAEGYGVEVALTIRALQQDFRVLEVMVDMQHRATGRDLSGFLHRARQYLDVRRTLKKLDS
jgi:hypothetical protein